RDFHVTGVQTCALPISVTQRFGHFQAQPSVSFHVFTQFSLTRLNRGRLPSIGECSTFSLFVILAGIRISSIYIRLISAKGKRNLCKQVTTVVYAGIPSFCDFKLTFQFKITQLTTLPDDEGIVL